jgi:hypothetical protein
VQISLAIAMAIVSGAFAAGGALAWLRADVKRALRMAHRAHVRIDELENQTGSHTTLRE